MKLKHDLNLLGLPTNRIHHPNIFPYLVSLYKQCTVYWDISDLVKPVSSGRRGLETLNLEIQLDIYPAFCTYKIAVSTNIKNIKYQLSPI